VLHVPQSYTSRVRVPLWLLAPGTGDTAEDFMQMSSITTLADKHGIACAALEGAKQVFNVATHALPEPYMPDDIYYTKEVLRDVVKRINIDRRTIRCVGFSRGARFCSRLASELSSFISAIAPVSGLRYPEPNNATHPMPIITFHGTADPVNPFVGKGNPEYWHESVLQAVQRWADWNGCKRYKEEIISSSVTYCKHLNCTDGAEVLLVQIRGGGHTWPGGSRIPFFPVARFGAVSHDIDSKIDIYNFFRSHPSRVTCHTAVQGEPCYRHILWVKKHGLFSQPQLYEGLSHAATLKEIQAVIHKNFYANCPPPYSESYY